MDRSESIVKLSQALLKAQKKIENAVKDSTNPHFKSKYAGLPEVMEACKEHLNESGIIVVQNVLSSDVGDFLETSLIHADSGEFMTSKMRLILDKQGMQAMGSSITYARRYALQSMVFISAEDDDGEVAEGRGPKVEEKKKELGQGFKKKPDNGGL